MLEHRWEKLSKKACEHADESMFPVGGFPVFCPAPLSTETLPAETLLILTANLSGGKLPPIYLQ